MENQVNPRMFTSTLWQSTCGVSSNGHALENMPVHAARHGGGVPCTFGMASPAVSHIDLDEGGCNGFSSL